MASEEPPAKKAKTEEQPFKQVLHEARDQAKAEHTREQMLNAIFAAWDKDGNGVIDFEEVLPHYMKSANHMDMQEQAVRNSFEKFMKAANREPGDGISPELFRKWLSSLTEDQVALQYAIHVMGVSEKPYAMNVNFAVDKHYENKSLKEVLDAPVSAIQGLTDIHGSALEELGLKTVRDLGQWRFFHMANAIVTLSAKEDDMSPEQSTFNIRHAVDKEHETKTLKQIANLPPSAFNMFPAKADEVLGQLKIRTIKSLGSRKVFEWASAMVTLEKYAA